MHASTMQEKSIEPSVWKLVLCVVLTAAFTAIAVFLRGLSVTDLYQPAVVVVGLMLLAWWKPEFRYCLSSLAILVAFSGTFSVLIYALGTSHWPLADTGLVAFGSWLGIDA